MSLDWKVFSELYRQSDGSMWGMTPHPSIPGLSSSLRVSRVTVWRSLRALAKSGFLKGFELFPNPRLFGVGLRQYDLSLRDSHAQHRLLSELEFVDGAFWIQLDSLRDAKLITIQDFSASWERRERMLRRIPGLVRLRAGAPAWLPECPKRLSPKDWQFVAALRRNPTGPLADVAAELGVSSRTASRRFATLSQNGALLGFWVEDFSKFPGVVAGFNLSLEPGVDGRTVLEAALRLFPDAFEPPAVTRSPVGVRSVPTILREIANVPEAEASTDALLEIPGVSDARVFFPNTAQTYRYWFDARIFERLAG
jgi:DNA-binding Lrp family transcriptional regulator